MRIKTNMDYPVYATIGEMKDGLGLEGRRSSCFIVAVLCKEDKEQLNRIEEYLKNLCLTKNDASNTPS